MDAHVPGGAGLLVGRKHFFQDNQSAIKLEKNGRASCGQKSRHIDIRFFFMKDRIVSEGIDIRYCPTEQMLADFFTKPLQGSLFKRFKRVVMGLDHVSTLWSMNQIPIEERVEKRSEQAPKSLSSPGIIRSGKKPVIPNTNKQMVSFGIDPRKDKDTISKAVRGREYPARRK